VASREQLLQQRLSEAARTLLYYATSVYDQCFAVYAAAREALENRFVKALLLAVCFSLFLEVAIRSAVRVAGVSGGHEAPAAAPRRVPTWLLAPVTESPPSLLMVVGDLKSGSTFVRQLLLDNLFVAPLDTHAYDHHNEVAMRNAREALGVLGNENIKRDAPADLATTFLDAPKHPRVVAATLVVVVTKDPVAWLVSTVKRPHSKAKSPTRKVSALFERSETLLDALCSRRATNLRAALALGRTAGRFEVVAYEDALAEPEKVVEALGAEPRRQSESQRRWSDLWTAASQARSTACTGGAAATWLLRTTTRATTCPRKRRKRRRTAPRGALDTASTGRSRASSTT